MLPFLAAIPIIGNVITGVTSAVFDAKVRIVQARTGAERDKAVEIVKAAATETEQATARLGIIAGNKLLTVLVVIFSLPFAIFIWKVVVIDIVLGLGTTDPIKGQVAEWANTIIVCLFGAPTAVTIGKMILSRKSE